MIASYVALAAGTLVSEDLACISAGVLVASGELSFSGAALACFVGITGGDLGLFFAGRLIGHRLASRVGSERLQRASQWLDGNTFTAVLASRFLPGTRTLTYVAAGILRTSARRFTACLVIAGAIWTPLLVGATATLGRDLVDSALSLRTAGLVVAAFLLLRSTAKLFDWESRRRLWGFVLRLTRWEFWPAWAAYAPLVPAFLMLSIRYRSMTAFTAANPFIPTGGLLDESKSEILRSIADDSFLAKWEAIQPGTPVVTDRKYPVVCKPDIGERGRGVAIVRTPAELTQCIAAATGTTIVQEYVGGLEFGLFYVRLAGAARGTITSVTAKRFPSVTGDGVRSLKQLILADRRAVAIADVYLRRRADAATYVPANGETVQLVEIGAHCGGTVFLDGTALKTPALEMRVDQIARSINGFHYGRFDVRTPSLEALQRGEFRILELNGVGAEPTHIYDPAVSLTRAYQALLWHWREAWAIGSANMRKGARLTSASQLLRLALKRLTQR